MSAFRNPPTTPGHVWIGSSSKSVKYTPRGSGGYIRVRDAGKDVTVRGYKRFNGEFVGMGQNAHLIPDEAGC